MTKPTRGGARPGSGRKASDVKLKKFSISAKLPDYELIRAEAEKQGMSISKYLILTALEKIKNN